MKCDKDRVDSLIDKSGTPDRNSGFPLGGSRTLAEGIGDSALRRAAKFTMWRSAGQRRWNCGNPRGAKMRWKKYGGGKNITERKKDLGGQKSALGIPAVNMERDEIDSGG